MPNTSQTPTSIPRRHLLAGGSAMVAAAALPVPSLAATQSKSQSGGIIRDNSGTFVLKDGPQLYYKDWGAGRPVVFSHGWPLDADAWDSQMFAMALQGYRVIAHDRRGHGRSSQTFNGSDIDTYAADVAAPIEHLGLTNIMMVGHSTGGGEVARYLGRYGTRRVSKAVLISAVPPLMLKTPENPGGLPMETFDKIRDGLLANRPQFFLDLAMPFFGFNRPGAKVSQGIIDSFYGMGMLGGIKSEYDCIKAFSETNFTEDLRKIEIPVLILQGDDDQIVPLDDSGKLSVKLLKNAKLKIYPGAPHGMPITEAPKVNADLLEFARS